MSLTPRLPVSYAEPRSDWCPLVASICAKKPTGSSRTFYGVRHALAAAVCLAGVLSVVARAQQPSDAFGKWAAERAIPLRTVEANGDATDLIPLKSLVGAARVVALGEPTHGAHEPLAFRNRLIRFLVEQMGFTAVALETGFTESSSVERFVAGGAGELHSVVGDGMTWGFGRFAENEELVQWIRDYNANTTHHRKVRFYGIDLSGGNQGTFPASRRAVDSVLEFLARADSAEASHIRRGLDPLLERFSSAKYSELSPAECDRLASGLVEVAAALERKRSRRRGLKESPATTYRSRQKRASILMISLIGRCGLLIWLNAKSVALWQTTEWHAAWFDRACRKAVADALTPSVKDWKSRACGLEIQQLENPHLGIPSLIVANGDLNVAFTFDQSRQAIESAEELLRRLRAADSSAKDNGRNVPDESSPPTRKHFYTVLFWRRMGIRSVRQASAKRTLRKDPFRSL